MRHSLRDINERLLHRSDAVYDIEYDDATRELHVWWWRASKSDPKNAGNPRRGTDHYVYYDVPWSVWDGLWQREAFPWQRSDVPHG